MRITKRQLRRIIKEQIIGDNVSLEIVLDGKGIPYDVSVPYYIIEDALEDGLGIDGLFIEIEEFIDGEYSPPDTYSFSREADEVIRKMHGDYQSGGVWSDERDYEAGFKR